VSTFLLIRHAENDYVKQGRLPGLLPGIHLNQTGSKQASTLSNWLAQKLGNTPVKAVYSSPLERGMETAEPIAKAFGLEVIPRPGLIETDCGDCTGKTTKSLRRSKLWRAIQQTPSQFQFPGGESILESQRRIVADLEALRSEHNPEDILVCVSHADPIKLAITHYLGMPLDNLHRLSIAPASITVLQASEHGARLLNLNFDPAFLLPKT
jgi:broad specificity phosphatase PhoE